MNTKFLPGTLYKLTQQILMRVYSEDWNTFMSNDPFFMVSNNVVLHIKSIQKLGTSLDLFLYENKIITIHLTKDARNSGYIFQKVTEHES